MTGTPGGSRGAAGERAGAAGGRAGAADVDSAGQAPSHGTEAEDGEDVALLGLRARASTQELLDGALCTDAELAGNMRDLARINRWTGGQWLVGQALDRLVENEGKEPLLLLDVGGGDGTGLAHSVARAARRGRPCRGVLLDRARPIIELALQGAGPTLAVVQGDGRQLPFRNRSVDVATCSLVLHHLSDRHALALVRELGRVARVGVIVDDLLRSHAGFLGARLLASVATHNRLTRHDGPLSVRRAFRAPELMALLPAAGLTPVWRRVIPGYRLVVAARPSITDR